MRKLTAGEVVDCGHYVFTENEIIDFASRHDPQDFHLHHEGATHSLFGRLTAAGVQSASATRKAVLRDVFANERVLGYPHVLNFRLYKPVYPNVRIMLSYEVVDVRPVSDVPSVLLIEGLTKGRTTEGVLTSEMRDQNWIAADTLNLDREQAALALLADDAAAPQAMGPPKPGHLAALKPGERIYFEDCQVGDGLMSAPFSVKAEDVDAFRRQFDTVEHRNEWLGPSFAIPMLADAFWHRAENTGGAGMELRIFRPVNAGDILRGRLNVVAVRPLKSRPGLGVVSLQIIAWNQRGELLFTFTTASFLRRRETGVA